MGTCRVLIAAALMLGACGSGGDDDGDASKEPSTTSTTTTSFDSVDVVLQHLVMPYDGSGILRETDERDSNCGITDLADSNDSLSYMEPGADVLLLDASGEIVARDKLDVGTAPLLRTDPLDPWFCEWPVTFTDVPESKFYEVEIDGFTAGTLDLDDLRAEAATGETELMLNER